jgi:hypothetical protein
MDQLHHANRRDQGRRRQFGQGFRIEDLAFLG